MVKNDPKQLIFENSGAKARNWNSTNIVRITTAMGLFTSSFEAKYKIISTTIDNKAQINVSMWFIYLNPMNKIRDPSAEGTGRKGTTYLDGTLYPN